MHKNTSTDTNLSTNATNTQVSNPLPNLLVLATLILLTLLTIYAGYLHGNMHLLTTLKNATS